MDSPRPTFPQYRVLADYTALTTREVNLTEGEVVELVKIGCAGWWYVRLTGQVIFQQTTNIFQLSGQQIFFIYSCIFTGYYSNHRLSSSFAKFQ